MALPTAFKQQQKPKRARCARNQGVLQTARSRAMQTPRTQPFDTSDFCHSAQCCLYPIVQTSGQFRSSKVAAKNSPTSGNGSDVADSDRARPIFVYAPPTRNDRFDIERKTCCGCVVTVGSHSLRMALRQSSLQSSEHCDRAAIVWHTTSDPVHDVIPIAASRWFNPNGVCKCCHNDEQARNRLSSVHSGRF